MRPLPPERAFGYAQALPSRAPIHSVKRRAMRTDGKQSALSLIKTAMIEKKMTQAELADAADIHEKTIQNLLSGRSVRDQTLFDVCMVLGLDFDKVRSAWAKEGGSEPRDAP